MSKFIEVIIYVFKKLILTYKLTNFWLMREALASYFFFSYKEVYLTRRFSPF